MPPSEARGRAGWLAQLSEEDVETSALLEMAGVRSDEDYLGARDRCHLDHVPRDVEATREVCARAEE